MFAKRMLAAIWGCLTRYELGTLAAVRAWNWAVELALRQEQHHQRPMIQVLGEL